MNLTRLAELFSEVVMLVLGLLILFLALSRRILVPGGMALWLALGAILVLWGGRLCLRRSRSKSGQSPMRLVRGGSLVLAGALMIAMLWLPEARAQAMLAAVGAIIALRGVAGAMIAARGLVRPS